MAMVHQSPSGSMPLLHECMVTRKHGNLAESLSIRLNQQIFCSQAKLDLAGVASGMIKSTDLLRGKVKSEKSSFATARECAVRAIALKYLLFMMQLRTQLLNTTVTLDINWFIFCMRIKIKTNKINAGTVYTVQSMKRIQISAYCLLL